MSRRITKDGREIVDRLTIGDQQLPVKFIGAGSVCMVYRIADDQKPNYLDVVKVFDPTIQGRPLLIRTQSTASTLEPISNLDKMELEILAQLKDAFQRERETVEQLDRERRRQNDNAFIRFSGFNEDSSYQFFEYSGGETLQARIDTLYDAYKASDITFQEQIGAILPLMLRVFEELDFYHEKGFLNLDLKAENLFIIRADGRDVAVRNLDFGSTISITDLLQNISTFSAEHAGLSLQVLQKKISEHFFVSSQSSYNNAVVKATIQICLSPNYTQAEKIDRLKRLDIMAAWRMFLFALEPELRHNDQPDIRLKSHAVRIFKDQKVSDSPLCNYAFFHTFLYEGLIAAINDGQIPFLDTKRSMVVLQKLLYMLEGLPTQETSNEILNAVQIYEGFAYPITNEALSSLLGAAGIQETETLQDILNIIRWKQMKNRRFPSHPRPAELIDLILFSE